MRLKLMILIPFGFAGAFVTALLAPDDADHTASTTPDFLAAFVSKPGQGVLDGNRCDPRMGPPPNPDEIEDLIHFHPGFHVSRAYTDRCNDPPSAYLSRTADDGTETVVESFCPTKSMTSIWRDTVRNDLVEGTVTWTATRFCWRGGLVLEFNRTLSANGADLESG